MKSATKSGISPSPQCDVLQGHQSNVKAVSFSSQGLLVSSMFVTIHQLNNLLNTSAVDEPGRNQRQSKNKIAQ